MVEAQVGVKEKPQRVREAAGRLNTIGIYCFKANHTQPIEQNKV
jgi:hypothetical protein